MSITTIALLWTLGCVAVCVFNYCASKVSNG